MPVLSPPAYPSAPAASGSAALLANVLLLAGRHARHVRSGRPLDVAVARALAATHTTAAGGGAS